MEISLIVALANNYCIGNNNQLPWRQSADLQHFKKLTNGKPIIMGRKTFESIGRPLPNRPNIIITRDKNYIAPGCEIYHSLDEALAAYKDSAEIMIIGGAQIFEQALPLATRMYLTWIDTTVEGDAFFPEFDKIEWQEVSHEKHFADEKNQFDYTFIIMEKHDKVF